MCPNRSLTNINTDREIEDASFLRLKNVQLGYSFPTKMLKNMKIRYSVYMYLHRTFGHGPNIPVMTPKCLPVTLP